VRNRVLLAARKKQTLEKNLRQLSGPMKVIDVVRTGYEHGFAAGLRRPSAKAIVELSETDAGRNLMRLFFLKQGAIKSAFARVAAKPGDVNYAAVIGGGTMGAGIVHELVRAGIPVRLVEVDAPAVSGALGRIKRMLD